MLIDYYTELNLNLHSSQEEIANAYQVFLAEQENMDLSEKQLKEKAFQILLDVKSRGEYNQQLSKELNDLNNKKLNALKSKTKKRSWANLKLQLFSQGNKRIVRTILIYGSLALAIMMIRQCVINDIRADVENAIQKK